MLSNNITAGCVESDETKSYSWIATPVGIMRCNLPLGDFFVYHVENKDFPNMEKINGENNYTKFTVLKNSINTSFVEPENDPSFAADGNKIISFKIKNR
ncbi:MAG: hypothetical protein HC854_00830 [Flavobacterium sp.]|nr:hypothetical protein [Flavobacterium sp.]